MQAIEYALRSGKFIFLFDGFDEIDPARRTALGEEILALSLKFGENLMILTSRPDNIFGSWNEFYVAEIQGFSEKQVLSLIEKLKYDKATRREFKALIKKGLYHTHQTYLSNPLLCTIMLMTFDQSAAIPTKMSIFFSQAFDTLYHKHDATKGTAFRRKFKTSFTIEDFRAALASFSTFAYLDYGITLKQAQAVRCVQSTMQFNCLSAKAEDFLDDLCSSISILIREGEQYNYIHRSFQEYFVAVFLATREVENFQDIIKKFITERSNDTVVPLLQDINPDKFENKFLQPALEKLRPLLEAIDIEQRPADAFALFFLGFTVNPLESDGITSWTVSSGNTEAPFGFMTKFFWFQAYSSVSPEPPEFDWHSHLKRALEIHADAFDSPLDSDEIHLAQPSNEILRNTPMVPFLIAIRDRVCSWNEELKSQSAKRIELVSTALLGRGL